MQGLVGIQILAENMLKKRKVRETIGFFICFWVFFAG
jgi:hypothetical protein